MTNERIRVTIALQPGDTADAALRLAKKFVLAKLESGPDPELDKARAILENPGEHIGNDVDWARKYIAALPPADQTPIL